MRAYVVPKDGHPADAAAITAWARGEMAAYKVPRDIVFVESLPRTVSNKIDWRRLQDQ